MEAPPPGQSPAPESVWHGIDLPQDAFRLDWLKDILLRLNPSDGRWPEAQPRLTDLYASASSDASWSLAQPFRCFVGTSHLDTLNYEHPITSLRGGELRRVLYQCRLSKPRFFSKLVVLAAERVLLHYRLWGPHGALDQGLCLQLQAREEGPPEQRRSFRFVIDVPAAQPRDPNPPPGVAGVDWTALLLAVGAASVPGRVPPPTGLSLPGDNGGGMTVGLVNALCASVNLPGPPQEDLPVNRLWCDDATFEACGRFESSQRWAPAAPVGTESCTLEVAQRRVLRVLGEEARATEETRRYFHLPQPEWESELERIWAKQPAWSPTQPLAHRLHDRIVLGGAPYHVKLLEDNQQLDVLARAEEAAQRDIAK